MLSLGIRGLLHVRASGYIPEDKAGWGGKRYYYCYYYYYYYYYYHHSFSYCFACFPALPMMITPRVSIVVLFLGVTLSYLLGS